MLRLSNDCEFDFCCGSGALGFDGCGWPWEWPLRWVGLIDPRQLVVVAKTVTILPRPGNLRWWKPWTCVWPVGDGFVNAVGLTNKGLDWWIETPYQTARKKGYNIAASAWPTSTEDSKTFVDKLDPLTLAYVELNLSCPNTKDHLAAAWDLLWPFQSLRHPLVLKVSYAQATDPEFLRMLRGVQAIHAINTVPWADIFPKNPSPLKKTCGVDGGVSGPLITEWANTAIRNIKKTLPNMPVIGGGGIEDVRDVWKMERAGASAFSIGSLFLKRPWKPRSVIARYRQGGTCQSRLASA